MPRKLTTRQKKYAINHHILGMTGSAAARQAGYKETNVAAQAWDNNRKPNIREYALSQIREKGLEGKVIDVLSDILNDTPSKPSTRQDQLGAVRQIADIAGLNAPKRQEKITLTGTFDAMSMAEKLTKLEELKQRLLIEAGEGTQGQKVLENKDE